MTTLRDHALVSAAAHPAPSRVDHPGPPRESSTALRPPAQTDTFVDGGWWPRSLDLVAELPQLLTAVEAAGYGEVRRVSYALAAWDGRPPRRTTMLDRVVKLGGFHSQDSAEIVLIDSSGWRRITIVVVPPDTDPTVADRAMATAGMVGDEHRAGEILDLARGSDSRHTNESGCVDELAAASWDSEGGRPRKTDL